MNRVQTIKSQIKKFEDRIASLRLELQDAYRNSYHTCKECGAKRQIGKHALVEYKGWNPNTGSPNGGYYETDSYHLRCPECQHYRRNEIEKDLAFEMWYSCKCRQVEQSSHY